MNKKKHNIIERVPEKCEYGALELQRIKYDDKTGIVHAYFIKPIKSLIMKFTLKNTEDN